MLVNQAFRYELDPNNATRSKFSSHTGASLFVFNLGLALVMERYAMREQVRLAGYRELLADEKVDELARTIDVPSSMYSLRKAWNAEKAEVAPWWAENSKFAYESGLKALAEALSNYRSSKNGTRSGPVMGFPGFKKKRSARRSCRFWAAGQSLGIVDERHVRIPRIGVVRSRERTTLLANLVADGRAGILNATLSEEADRWFLSFCCEVERSDPKAVFPDVAVGADLGVHHLAALSTGALVENPKALARYQKKMNRLQRELKRRQPGSKRRARTKHELRVLHRRVACTRKDALHQLSSRLAANYGTVVVEDLNVEGMTASGRGRGRRGKAGLNRAVLDVETPAEFRRQLTYKLAWHGGTLVVADRWFSSSKICSSCGAAKAKLPLSTRIYRCACGLEMDRDLNAARNLQSFRINVAEGSSETKSGRRGDEVQGGDTRCSPVKRLDGSGQPQKTILVGQAK